MTKTNDERAPYSLFQGENGKWGVKDKNGVIVDEARYIRQYREDGNDTFFDGISEVNCFSPEEGFTFLAWMDPDFLELLSQDDEDDEECDENR